MLIVRVSTAPNYAGFGPVSSSLIAQTRAWNQYQVQIRRRRDGDISDTRGLYPNSKPRHLRHAPVGTAQKTIPHQRIRHHRTLYSSGTSAEARCVSWETWKTPSIPEEHGAICLNARPPSLERLSSDEYSAIPDACNQASAAPDACNQAFD